ncbi:MAG: glutathione S-transferase family protein [Methylocystis sp.]
MITLYCFRSAPGLPDISPFVAKTMLLLKLAGLEYEENRNGYPKAPKGKLPYIDDEGTIVADSTFIRWHIEKAHGVDFDAHLTPEQRAIGWATEKMCEDHLYWILVRGRWLDDANFARGPAKIFDRAPAPTRPVIKWMVRRKVAKSLYLQGIGRHTGEEAAALGVRDVEALATLLGDQPYLFGETPSGADATVFAFVAGLLSPSWESPVRDAAASKANLVAYRDRVLAKYFPDIA